MGGFPSAPRKAEPSTLARRRSIAARLTPIVPHDDTVIAQPFNRLGHRQRGSIASRLADGFRFASL